MSDAKVVRSPRLEVVDAVRGLAVLAMIEWHTADAWIREPERLGAAFDVAELIGGLAAPFFFLLAGLSLGLGERLPTPAASVGAGVRRAARIVLSGYGLRTWSWGIDRAAILDPGRLPHLLLFSLGLGLLYWGLGDDLPPLRRRTALGVGAVLAAGAAWTMPADGASAALRLDVLHGIGASLVVVVLVLAASSRLALVHRVAVVLVLALVVALVAPHLTSWRPPDGPIRVWDYVGRFDVSPRASGARFPFVPWLGYALLGSAVGRSLRGRSSTRGRFGLPIDASPIVVLVVATLLVVVAFEPGPISPTLLRHAEWLRGVDRLVFYSSVAVASASTIAVLRDGRVPSVLALLGRHSLVIYAVHLEIAYGLPGTVVAHALGWGPWAALALLLLVAMVALAHAIERFDRKLPRDHERSATARA